METAIRNNCGDCTVCCVLLPVPALEKEANVQCKFCVLKTGCNNYDARPQACKDFDCAYLQMDKVHLDLRPDNCKMIFEKISDRLFFGTQDPRFDQTKVAKKQIEAFNKQGFSVIISDKRYPRVTHLAEDHDIKNILEDYDKFVRERK